MESRIEKTTELRVPAIEVSQGPGRLLYSFAVDGKVIPSFATVSRIRRNGNAIEGYQRPEVVSHILEIRNYLEGESPMIPNAIIIAFDSRVRFESADMELEACEFARTGTLVIPVDDTLPDDHKPGFVVDGQQRLAAIRDANIDAFPICVTAFVTNDVHQQTEQFILVNSTKPLPKGLIYELLPNTQTPLPTLLQRRRFPAYLLDRLNRDYESPMRDLIQTPTTPEGFIKDNSVLRMLENSLSDGVLYRFRGIDGKDPATDRMLETLIGFWGAVSDVFKEAWALPAKRSRLMHGAGIVGMGFVMDAISERHRSKGVPSKLDFLEDLAPLKEVCRWTEGYWDFGPGCQRKWNEIQNTSKDIQILANYLLVQYKALVWNRTAANDGVSRGFRQQPLDLPE